VQVNGLRLRDRSTLSGDFFSGSITPRERGGFGGPCCASLPFLHPQYNIFSPSVKGFWSVRTPLLGLRKQEGRFFHRDLAVLFFFDSIFRAFTLFLPLLKYCVVDQFFRSYVCSFHFARCRSLSFVGGCHRQPSFPTRLSTPGFLLNMRRP